MQESLQGLWWIAEFVPKLVYQPASNTHAVRFGLGRHRPIQDGAIMDASVLERIRRTAYRPPNMSDDFIAKVKGLTTVPPTYPYTVTRP